MAGPDYPDFLSNPLIANVQEYTVVTTAPVDITTTPPANRHLILAGVILSNHSPGAGSITIGSGGFDYFDIQLQGNTSVPIPLFSFNLPDGAALEVLAITGTWGVGVFYGEV